MDVKKVKQEVKVKSAQHSTSMDPATLMFALPRYDGTGPFNRFVDNIKIYGALQGWDDAKIRAVLPLCLTGIARDAFDAIPKEKCVTLDTTVTELKKNFVDPSTLEKHLMLHNLSYNPSESLDQFVVQLKKKVSRAFPGQIQDSLLLNHFISALNPEFRSAVVAAGCETFEQAVSKVRNLKSAANAGSVVTPVRAVSTADRQSVPPDVVPQLLARIGELESQLAACSGGHGQAQMAPRHMAPRHTGVSPNVSRGGGVRGTPRDPRTCCLVVLLDISGGIVWVRGREEVSFTQLEGVTDTHLVGEEVLVDVKPK